MGRRAAEVDGHIATLDAIDAESPAARPDPFRPDEPPPGLRVRCQGVHRCDERQVVARKPEPRPPVEPPYLDVDTAHLPKGARVAVSTVVVDAEPASRAKNPRRLAQRLRPLVGTVASEQAVQMPVG